VDHITMEHVRELLETSTIPGSPEEQEVFIQWMERLAQKKGIDYVKKYRRKLFNDWKQLLEIGLSRV